MEFSICSVVFFFESFPYSIMKITKKWLKFSHASLMIPNMSWPKYWVFRSKAYIYIFDQQLYQLYLSPSDLRPSSLFIIRESIRNIVSGMWGCGCLSFPLQPFSTLRYKVIIIIGIRIKTCLVPRLHPLLLSVWAGPCSCHTQFPASFTWWPLSPSPCEGAGQPRAQPHRKQQPTYNSGGWGRQ